MLTFQDAIALRKNGFTSIVVKDSPTACDGHVPGILRPWNGKRKKSPLDKRCANVADAAALTDPNPTEAQKASGNYRKGTFQFGPFRIVIETPKGALRSGVDPNGDPWSVTMPAHYGYIQRVPGNDGDCLDCYVGPDETNPCDAYIIDQHDLATGKFDEHKVMLGYPSEAQAIMDYDAAFSDGKGPQRRKHVHRLGLAEFKRWCDAGMGVRKADGRRGRDGDGDGKLNEGRDRKVDVLSTKDELNSKIKSERSSGRQIVYRGTQFSERMPTPGRFGGIFTAARSGRPGDEMRGTPSAMDYALHGGAGNLDVGGRRNKFGTINVFSYDPKVVRLHDVYNPDPKVDARLRSTYNLPKDKTSRKAALLDYVNQYKGDGQYEAMHGTSSKFPIRRFFNNAVSEGYVGEGTKVQLQAMGYDGVKTWWDEKVFFNNKGLRHLGAKIVGRSGKILRVIKADGRAGRDGDGDGILNEKDKARVAAANGGELETQRTLARRVGAWTGAAGSVVGGLAGGLVGGGIASTVTGIAGSVAGDRAARELGERTAYAAQAKSLMAAWRRFKQGVTYRDVSLGEHAGSAIGALSGGKIATHVAQGAIAATGTRGRLLAEAFGLGAGETAGAIAGRAADKEIKKSWSFSAEICKADEEERVVYGFATVSEKDGGVVIDKQGDMVTTKELVKMAHKFISKRTAGDMHAKIGVGEVVESIVLRPELQKALGVNIGKTAWLIGMKINDDATWERVKKGELKAFSIGGRGRRKTV